MFNKDKKTTIIFAAALFVSGFLIYSNVLNAPFIHDDERFIKDNFWLRDLSNFKDFSGTRYIGFLSFALNYYFNGLDTFGYHIVNIVIHILNAVLVYVLVSLTFAALSLRGALAPKQSQNEIASALPRNDITPNLIAFVVSLIFLVHPIQTETVSYIFQRVTSLATFFYLLALVLYVKGRINTMLNFKCLMLNNSKFKIKHLTLYFLSILSAILAMKTKEFSFTLPFIIILYEWTFFGKPPLPLRERGGKRFLHLTPYLLTLAIIPIELFSSNTSLFGRELEENLRGGAEDMFSYNYPVSRLYAVFEAIVTFIRLMFLPINQHFVYDNLLSSSVFEIKTLLSLAFVISILCFAVYLYIRSIKTNNTAGLLISFGIFWFFITLSMNLIMAIGVIIEHWLYLPSIGFILSAAAGCLYLYERVENREIKNLLLSFVIIVIPVLSYAAYERNNIYNDKITMWLDDIRYNPNNLYKRTELEKVYREKGMFDKAHKERNKIIELQESDPLHNYILGWQYFEKNMFDDAEREFKRSMQFDSKLDTMASARLHYSLGFIYFQQNRIDEAEKEFLIALKFNPYISDVHAGLGNIYSTQGRFDDAVNEYRIALKLKSDNAEIYNNLGASYFNKGLWAEAIKEYLNALKIKPDFAEAHYNLGKAYAKLGEIDNAIKELLTVIRLQPDHLAAHYNLGIAYQIKGLKDSARKEFEIVLKLTAEGSEFNSHVRKAMEAVK